MAKDMISEFYKQKTWTERSFDSVWRVIDNLGQERYKHNKRLEGLEEYITKGLTKKVRSIEKEVYKLGFLLGAATTLGVYGYKAQKKKIAELNKRVEQLNTAVATLNDLIVPKVDMTKYDTADVNSVILEGPFTRLLKNGEKTSKNESGKDEK